MTILENLRERSQKVIDENPTSIVIHRITRVDDGAGGWSSVPSDLPPFTGRLVASRRHARTQDEAAMARVAEFALIAPHTADIRDGIGVEDTFTVGGKSYRVTRVIPRKWAGEVYAVHATLEEVS